MDFLTSLLNFNFMFFFSSNHTTKKPPQHSRMPWWSIPNKQTPTACAMRIQNAASDAFPPSKGGRGDVLCHDRLFFTHFSLPIVIHTLFINSHAIDSLF
jgi:hypothetical protein